MFVEAITRVLSVDLVADPATTRGLFESVEAENAAALGRLTLEQFTRCRPDLVEAIRQESAGELARLRETVSRMEADAAGRRKRELAMRLLAEFHLPDPDASDGGGQAIVGRRFLESLHAAPDEQAMRDLVEERARLVKALAGSPAAGPRSREQGANLGREPVDPKWFAAAIT